MASYHSDCEVEPTLGVVRNLQTLKACATTTARRYHELRGRLTALEASLAAEQANDRLTGTAYALLQSEIALLQARTKTAQIAAEAGEKSWADAAHAEAKRQAQAIRAARRDALQRELTAVHAVSSAPGCYSHSQAEIEQAAHRKSAILQELITLKEIN